MIKARHNLSDQYKTR